MTDLEQLREQLRLANADVAKLEAERNELAFRLGQEIAENERLKKSIAITDANVRRMQVELNELRNRLRDCDCGGLP